MLKRHKIINSFQVKFGPVHVHIRTYRFPQSHGDTPHTQHVNRRWPREPFFWIKMLFVKGGQRALKERTGCTGGAEH